MDEKVVLKVLDSVSKSSDKKYIYKQLVKIRTELIKNDSGIHLFAKLGGIKILVKLTEQLDEEILSVALSILGNCCTVEKCRQQAFECGIIPNLVAILSLQNVVIQNRASRLIGNMAIKMEIAEALQESGVAFGLNSVLEDNDNMQLLLMAIRAISKLWSIKKFRNEVVTLEIIKKIMIVLEKLLKSNETLDEPKDDSPAKSNTVILRRQHEPDRTVTKEKLAHILRDLEKSKVEIDYEIIHKPERHTLEKEFTVPTDKESREVINNILKFLLLISTANHPEIARQIYGNGNGYPNLIFLSLEKSKYRSIVLKILSNLSSNSWAQGFLSSNDLILHASHLLINNKTLNIPLEANEVRYCVCIVCLASENACNRNKLRRSGVLKVLLEIAKTTETTNKLLGLILFCLYQFRFDNLGLSLLLQDGLINVLIKIISDIISKMKVDHMSVEDAENDETISEEFKIADQKDKKRGRNISPTIMNYSSFSKYRKIDYYDPESPSSSGYGSNNFQYSPSRSSFYSPYNSPGRSNDEDDDDFDSDTYSPVCSDEEEANEPPELPKLPEPEIPQVPKKEFNVFSLIYDNATSKKFEKWEENILEPDENSCSIDTRSEAEETTGKSVKSSKEQEDKDSNEELTNQSLKFFEKEPLPYILILLWKVSIQNNNAPDFVRLTTLDVLLKVCRLVKKPNGRIFQILENIVVEIRNFIPILKQDFIFKLHELKHPDYEHENCYSCNKMCQVGRDLLRAFGGVAESGYGRGEIEHILVTGDEDSKRRIAIQLTYIISTPEFLNKMLFYHKAFEIVVDLILKHENEKTCEEAACGLTTLAINLRIHHSVEPMKQNEHYNEDKHEELLKIFGENLVKFVVGDKHLYFDKDILVQKSDVFVSMFANDFRESKMNEVRLANCSIGGLKYFFHLILLEHQKELKKVAPRINDMSEILEAYQLSLQYIIPAIQKPLVNVIKIVIDHENSLSVFEWSLQHVNQGLLEISICYFLGADIDGKKKVKMFRDANKSMYSKEWNQMIYDSIFLKCQSTD